MIPFSIMFDPNSSAQSQKRLDWAERNPCKACLAWHTLNNMCYMVDGKTATQLTETCFLNANRVA